MIHALASAALLTMAGPALAATPVPRLTCTLQAPAQVAVGAPALLTFTLRNPGPQPVDVLVWGTPFEPQWFAPYVAVQRGGTALPYGGAQMKRGDPGAGDYLRIDGGQQRAASIDLAGAFSLDVPGRYHVQPRIVLHDVVAVVGTAGAPRPRDRHAGVPLDCNAVDIDVVR